MCTLYYGFKECWAGSSFFVFQLVVDEDYCGSVIFGCLINGVSSAESSRSVRGLGKGVSGKPYPRMCDARRP